MTSNTTTVVHKGEINQRKQQEEQLLLQANVLRHVSDAIITVDREYCIISWNPAAETIYGWEEEHVLGQRISAILHTEYPQDDEGRARMQLELHGEWRGEVVQNHRNGTKIVILSSVSWIRDSSGQRIGAVAVNRDITERKNAQEILRKSEERFSKIFLANPAAQAIIRKRDNQILDVNEGYAALIGYSREALIGRDFNTLEAITDKQKEELGQQFAAHQGTLRNLEITLRTASRDVREGLLSVEMLELDGEECFLTIVVDNTERKRAERKIEKLYAKQIKSEKQFRGLVENSKDLFIVATSAGVQYVSNNIRQILGYTPKEYKRLSVAQLIHPDDLPLRWDELKNPGDVIQLTFRSRHKNGEWRWMEGTGMNLFHVEGVGGILFTLRDITEKKHAEDALRESEARLLQLTESLPQLVWTAQPDGPCDYLSKQWVEYTGIPEEPQLGFGWVEQIHPEDREAAVAAWNQAVENRTDFRIEQRIRRHDGEYRWFYTIATRLYSAQNRLFKWFGSSTDIEDKKQIELENKRVNEELDKFVYSASHDLRSPLVGIMGLITIARDDVMRPSLVKSYLDKMQTCTKKLDTVLESILEYSYNSRLEVTVEAVAIRDLIDHCFASLDHLPGFKEVEKRIEVQQPAGLLSDRYRLELIFSSLLKNALQFRDTQKQSSFIHIAVSVTNWLEIRIQDNGIGIKQLYIPKVFNMFYRASNRSQGAGLGLYIAREVVTKLKGEIEVQSWLGEGTTVTVTLPLVGSEHPVHKPEPTE